MNFAARTGKFAFLGMLLALSLADAATAGTITYTYDDLGRLKTAVYSDGTTITYTYDAAGNRTQYVVSP